MLLHWWQNSMSTHRLSIHNEPSFTEAAAAVHGTEEIDNHEVGLQLQRILASAPFRNSKRNTQFLRFVVEKALAGNTSEIKERLIGIEVFGRPADYDLSAEAIVRVAAAELRKRIAQYYAEPEHAGELRVELPVGTYAPAFYWPNPAVKEKHDAPVSEPGTNIAEGANVPAAESARSLHPSASRAWSPRTTAVVVASLIVLVAAGALVAAYDFHANSPRRSLDKFWAPLMNEGDSITVCVGDLNYVFQAPPFSKFSENRAIPQNPISSNAGAALLRVGTILGSRGKRSTLRLADLTELNDLRQQPVIFIGGMNNPWTQRILAGLRFRLMAKPGGINGDYGLVIDGDNPALAAWRVDLFAPLSTITHDYSLVTRLNDPLTGEPIVILCGVGPYGTGAASEFVSNPYFFAQFSKQAPKGWESRNIQIVLETTVVNGRVSVPRVVAEQVY